MHQIVVELRLFHMALSACARRTAIEGMAISSFKSKKIEYVMLTRVCREDIENSEGTVTPIVAPVATFGIEDISLLFLLTALDWFCKLAYILLSTSDSERHCVVRHCHHGSRVGAQDKYRPNHLKRTMVSPYVVIVIALVFSDLTYGALLLWPL